MSRSKVCSWLMDLGSSSTPMTPSNQPPASSPRDLPAMRQPPLAEVLLEEGLFEPRQVADFTNVEGVQMLLRHLAHAGDLAHVERREPACLASRQHPEHAVGLGLIGGDFGHQARGGDADRAVQPRLALHRFVELVRGGERGAEQPLGAGHVEVGFVDRGHLDLRAEAAEHLEDLLGVLAIALGMAVEEDGLRAELVGRPQRHCRVHSELAGRVGRRRDHAALVRAPADHHRLAFERRVEQFLHRHKEGIHVDVEDASHKDRGTRAAVRANHVPRSTFYPAAQAGRGLRVKLVSVAIELTRQRAGP